MAIKPQKTDIVTIGLGGAAGLAVLPLAEAGAKIIGLEAGGWLAPADFPSDEVRNNILTWMGNSKFNRDAPTWRPNDKVKAVRRRTGPLMSAVGGSTIHYGAQSWRWAPWVFTARSSSIAHYGPGSIPPNSTLTDWPVTYSDLEPYYDKVEDAIGVSGLAGNIAGRLHPLGNTFEGPRSREYPMPPLRSSGYTRLVSDAAKRLGWNPFPGPSAINSVPRDGRGPCQYHGFCQPNGCPHNAKGSPNVTTIPKALATKNLTVVTEARVTRIEVDRQGRATGVSYVKGGVEYFQPASVVILSAFTYENVRLLLLSKSPGFTNGLANNSGQVGKHYIGHLSTGLNAIFPGKKLNRFTGTVSQCTGVDNWNADHFDHTGLGFIGGGNIAMRMEAYPIATSRAVPPGMPRWGAAYKAFLQANANSIGSGYNQHDTLPYEEHFLDLDPDNRDPDGNPLLRVTSGLQEQERLRAHFTRGKAIELFKEAGASTVWGGEASPPQVTNHAIGGTRMGNDPATSVVNSYGLAHEVPNLMILGGSVLVSHGGSNPTLTLQAVAWRNAEHLITNWRSIAKGASLRSAPNAQ
jgi:gluconate 2-dehydrogenase alpha chain